MPSPTRYTRAPDGTRLAWTRRGSGRPAVLLTDGIGCAGYIWASLAPALAEDRAVLHWNYRGHGASDTPPDGAAVTVEGCVDDLLAVLDEAGEERAVLAGHSMGVQIVVEAHRRAPERVAGLLLVCGAPGRLIDTFHDSPALKVVFPYAAAAFRQWPNAAAAAFRATVRSEVAMEYALAFEVNRALVRREDLRRYFDDLSQVDAGLFVTLLESAARHDVTHHLPRIDVPTLVVAGERDGFTPMRLSVAMHEAIPGSELLVLPAGTHVGPLEHPELVNARVRDFLAQRIPVRRRRRAAEHAGRPRAAAAGKPAERKPAVRKPAGRKAAAPRRRTARRRER
jgi:pimeloyl-ACP methyl ester carboxylesterase